MSGRSSLARAKALKENEFYTRREDIENELSHYAEHFRDKVVYCNCDDTEDSEFWGFFVRNFKPWGLKKLVGVHYEPDDTAESYYLELSSVSGGDGRSPLTATPAVRPLACNGDFRSESCIELMKGADIVVTNPPFPLFREYVAQMMQYDKKFLIVGNANAVTYKEIFPLLQQNRIWLGYTHPKIFLQPDGTEKHYGNIVWMTNMDIPRRHAQLDLRGNYFDPETNLRYQNYDAVNVDKVNDIPCDYDGVMGVPITFLESHCPDDFEILGCHEPAIAVNRLRQQGKFKAYPSRQLTIDGVLCQKTYHRIFIRRKSA